MKRQPVTILFDCTHTSHCTANTGVQRVTRRLAEALAEITAITPVVCDPYAGVWRKVGDAECRRLTPQGDIRPGTKRSAVWDIKSRWTGYIARFGLRQTPHLPKSGAAVLPEVFGDHRADGMVGRLRESVDGPVIAIFHDLIPLQMPVETPLGTLASFRRYLKELATVDIIAAVSAASADALRAQWEREGISSLPRIVVIPLATDKPGKISPLPENSTPRILCVGSLEGRKNHVALLEAAETLWRDGISFELELIGLAHTVTGADAVKRIRELQADGRPLIWHGAVSDMELEDAYARSHFTVYPSLLEGFGLPVIESLARGRACICSGLNAMAESARDGGCLTIGTPSPAALAQGMRLLIHDQAFQNKLQKEAMARPVRDWGDYAKSLISLATDFNRQ